MTRTEPTFSLVLPCYCEVGHLEASLERIVSFLDYSGLDYEIILVEDCSPDNTAELVRAAEQRYPRVRALYHEVNQGRGAAVTTGLQAARGRYAGFIDVDLEVDVCYIPALVLELERGADVVTGWRHYNMSVVALMRYFASKGYQRLSRWMLGMQFQDTETGYKLFRREAILPVNEQVVSRGWFWDTEIMVRSQRAGLRIVEVPVLFKRCPEKKSTVRLIPDTIDYFRELRRLCRQLAQEAAQAEEAAAEPQAVEYAPPSQQATGRQ